MDGESLKLGISYCSFQFEVGSSDSATLFSYLELWHLELLSTDEALQANINQLIAMESQDDVFGDASADLSPGNNILFIYQDKNEDKNQNQSFRSFLYVLKQSCDEQTNNSM